MDHIVIPVMASIEGFDGKLLPFHIRFVRYGMFYCYGI